MGLEAVPYNFATGRLEDLVRWARRNSVFPATFGLASHVGRYGWTTIRLDRVDPDELRELVVEAWRRTAPKRAVATFDAG